MQDSKMKLVFLLILGLIALYIVIPMQKKPLFEEAGIVKGIDLQGGAEIIVELVPIPGQSVDLGDATEQAKEVLEKRINFSGLREPIVRTAGEGRIIIQLPGFDQRQTEDVKKTLSQAGRLTFHIESEEAVWKSFTYPQVDNPDPLKASYQWFAVNDANIGAGYWNESRGNGHILLRRKPEPCRPRPATASGKWSVSPSKGTGPLISAT
jgi:preprotein translocase subunit SecD